jgi:hypothetical protein
MDVTRFDRRWWRGRSGHCLARLPAVQADVFATYAIA